MAGRISKTGRYHLQVLSYDDGYSSAAIPSCSLYRPSMTLNVRKKDAKG